MSKNSAGSIYQNRLKKGKLPHQIWWDVATKAAFTRLVHQYDPRLEIATAILKLVEHALKDNWIPGYIRQERVITNRLTDAIDKMGG